MIALNQGESIKKIIRRHQAWFLFEFLLIVFISVLPYIGWKIGFFDRMLAEDPNHLAFLLVFFYSIWLIACWSFLFIIFLEYYLNQFILTDSRLLMTKQTGLWSRKIQSYEISKFREIRVNTDKSMTIAFTGEDEDIKLPSIEDPDSFKEIILSEQKKTLTRLSHTLTIDEEEAHMI
jgi:hypothetical protein